MAHGLQIHYKRDTHLVKTVMWLLLVALIAAGGWLGYRYFTKGELPLGVNVSALQGNTDVDESNVTPDQVAAHTVADDEPRYISIPSLAITNARVFGIGVDDNNQLDSPKNINDAGWYTKSAKPGQGFGAVLIDGHNGGTTKDGVFAQLKTLKTDDTITLERGDGSKLTYRVVENQSMPIEEVNATGMQMMGESAEQGVEGLNIITCDGNYVPKLGQFDRRIMLRAVLVE